MATGNNPLIQVTDPLCTTNFLMLFRWEVSERGQKKLLVTWIVLHVKHTRGVKL